MPRILVVEDDPDLLFLYQTALTQNGFEAILADTATLAIAELDQGIFDLMILDLNMPDAHGTVVVDHMRADVRHAKTHILVVTANDHWVNDVLHRDIKHILVKPVSMREIISMINKLIASQPE